MLPVVVILLTRMKPWVKKVLEAAPNWLHVQACPQTPFLREEPVSTGLAASRWPLPKHPLLSFRSNLGDSLPILPTGKPGCRDSRRLRWPRMGGCCEIQTHIFWAFTLQYPACHLHWEWHLLRLHFPSHHKLKWNHWESTGELGNHTNPELFWVFFFFFKVNLLCSWFFLLIKMVGKMKVPVNGVTLLFHNVFEISSSFHSCICKILFLSF